MDMFKDFTEGFAKTSLGSLCFRRHEGNGETLVLLHGIGATMQSWQRFVEYLPEDLNVYMLDLLGHGKSEKPNIKYTVDNQAESIWEFAKAQNLKNHFVMGNSYGGLVAMVYSKYGNVKGLILEDSLGLPEYFEEILSKGAEHYKEAMMKVLLRVNDNDRHVMESSLDEETVYSHKDAYEIANESHMPTLIVWGGNDNIINPKYAEIFNKRIDGSTLVIIDGADHVPHHTKPEETAHAVVDFIRRR